MAYEEPDLFQRMFMEGVEYELKDYDFGDFKTSIKCLPEENGQTYRRRLSGHLQNPWRTMH